MLSSLNRFLYKLFLSQLAYELWISFNFNPDDWTDYEDCYRVTHKSGMKLWIAGGPWFCNIEHEGNHNDIALLGYIDRHFVWLAFNKARKVRRRVLPKILRTSYANLLTKDKNK